MAPPMTTMGLFADGQVGAAVTATMSERCPDRLAYVVAPSWDSPVVACHAELKVAAPLLIWSEATGDLTLPRHHGSTPQIVLLAWWPHIVRPPFLSAGQAATLNMHPSLLPYGRGKDPNFWALAEDEPFGVTIHHVDDGVDTGDIAFQSPIPKSWEDTGATLHARAQQGLIELFQTSLEPILALDIPRIPQLGGNPARRRGQLQPRSTLSLDEPTTGRKLLNLLRARTFPPHPGCCFTDDAGSYQIRIHIEKIEN